MFKDCFIDGFGPTMERDITGSGTQTLFDQHIGNALCGNTRSQCLDTSRISSQNALTPFQKSTRFV
jgi:hypothetical protein